MNGDENTTGLVTNGGSESIFLGILAHKRYYFKKYGITKPEIVVSETVHLAFKKACEFQEIKFVVIPLNRKTLAVTAEEYRRYITPNTICIVGSAPNFAYGTVDPLGGLSELAGEFNTGFFIDGCMGSYLLPFVDEFGIKTGEKYVDLRNKNVTAMSCDTHKYALAPKGTSVVLFPNSDIQNALYFGATDWLAGIYGTPMIAGSRGSSLIASTWAVCVTMGREGYAQHAKNIYDGTSEYVRLIGELNQYVKVVGNPCLGNVSVMSNNRRVDMYKLGSSMDKKGWYLGGGNTIRTLMMTITDRNWMLMKDLVNDLKDCIADSLANPNVKLNGLFKVADAIKYYPSWITNDTVCKSMHHLYEIKWLDHDTKKDEGNEVDKKIK